METYDIIMLVVAVGATLFGFIKGFAWQLASLASLVLSYFCALKFADQLAPHIHDNPQFNKYLAMLVIYVGTSFAVWMVLRIVSGTIDKMKLREFDHQMGGLLGVAKGVLFCTVITFFAVTLTEQTRGAVLRSKSGVYISQFLHQAEQIMPPELKPTLEPYIAQIKLGLDPMQKPEMQNPLENLPAIPQQFSDPFQNRPLQYQPSGYQQQLPPGYPSGAMNPPPAGNYAPPGGYQNNGGYAPTQPSPYGVPGQPYQPAAQPNFQPVR